jgi:hypothetical protein
MGIIVCTGCCCDEIRVKGQMMLNLPFRILANFEAWVLYLKGGSQERMFKHKSAVQKTSQQSKYGICKGQI